MKFTARTTQLLALAALVIGPLTAHAATIQVTPIANGLNNPRGITIAPNGAIWVAEAGTGGNLGTFVSSDGSTQYVGFTGSLTRILNGGGQARVVTGLPSHAAQDGSFAVGSTDVSAAADGSIRFIVGWGADPRIRQSNPNFMHFGWDGMYRKGRAVFLRDISAFEVANNPDGGAIDSDPYSMLADGETNVVAEAGANALLRVGPGRQISTMAVFPERLVPNPFGPGDIPMESVPDSVVKGPDGAYYVGELTGFPFVPGAARVYRVVDGQAPTIFAEGFTNIIDIAFGPDGSLYVLEISANGLLSNDLSGALIKIAPDSTRTTILTAGLVAPGGMAIAADGTIYVSNMSVFPGAGQVLRVIEAP